MSRSTPPDFRTLTTDRRRFLAHSAGGMAAIALGTGSNHALSAELTAADVVAGKDPRMIILEKAPAVLETPLNLLGEHAVTPTSLLFVRNNQDLATGKSLQPISLEGWKIEISGLVNRSRTFAASDLLKLDHVEHEMVLQCSGNSRSLFAKAVQSKGTQWGRGGVGNVKIQGVKLSTVLKSLGIEVGETAHYLSADGKDGPPPDKDDFQHSIPVEDALQKSILALRMNGEPIPGIHGGPVRLITPGFFATMNLKWLTRLQFEPAEIQNYNQIPRYRTPNQPIVPGTPIEYTLENSRPNYAMKVKSIIFNPLPDAKLPAGQVTVSGVAFNDGAARIESVLVSTNRGESWQRAKLTPPTDLYGWTRWSTSVTLPKGSAEIWSKATDALGRSQPLDGTIHWNPSGYEWNGVEMIPVMVG